MNEERNRAHSLHPDELSMIAGYLDGSLSEEERMAAEALLARSEAGREVLADAVRLADEFAPPAQGDQSLLSDSLHLSPRVSRWRWTLLASAAAVLLIALPLTLRRGSTDSELVLATLDETLVTSPQNWSNPVWPVVRGEAPTGATEASFRAGVRWTDFLVAWKAGLTREAQQILEEIVRLVEPLPLSGPPLSALRQVGSDLAQGGTPSTAGSDLAMASEMLGATDRTFGLGVLVESARLAALANDTSFLTDRGFRRSLARLAEASWPVAVSQPLSRLAAAVPGDTEEIIRAAEDLTLAVR